MRTISLPENHLMMNVENDMQHICGSILKPLGITYFNYLRYYNDGTCYLLITHTNVLEYVFKHNIPVAAPLSEKYIKKNFNYFILPTGPYNQFIHHAKVNLKLGNFIDLVDRHDNYFELYCFGSTPNNPEIINFYLNNFDFLEKFKSYFKDKASNLLQEGERNKVKLPEIMKPPYEGLKSKHKDHSSNIEKLQRKKYLIETKYENISLSQRQYDCLSQIAAGRTAKEAAFNLDLSHRTVENYLANLKTTLHCYKKSQLIDIFLKNFKQEIE